MQSEFEKYLKNSPHFADVINTHRAATAQVVGAFIALLVQDNHVSVPAVSQLLKRLEEPMPGGVSLNSERRRLVALIGDALKQ